MICDNRYNVVAFVYNVIMSKENYISTRITRKSCFIEVLDGIINEYSELIYDGAKIIC